MSFEVEPGSALGVIGRNGSGKSSLLKLIAGIYRPDSGQVFVEGRVSALIELGAGFHPDFTGRENVQLGGVMYGLSKREVEERMEDIVRYAELEDFIDNPIRTYSSGMYMRLGFSLAVHTNPDVLLIDEVLSVGDVSFVARCHETLLEFRRKGKTLLFVTHDLDSVLRWCDEAIWLDKGVIRKRGEPRLIVDSYLEAAEEDKENELREANALSSAQMSEQEEKRWGNRDVEILTVRMYGNSGEEAWVHHPEDRVVVELDYLISRPVSELAFGVGILSLDGVCIHGTNTDIEECEVPLPDFRQWPAGEKEGLFGTCVFSIERLGLAEETYYLDVAAHRSDGLPYDYHHRLYQFSVRSTQKYHGVYIPKSKWEFRANYGHAKQLVAKR